MYTAVMYQPSTPEAEYLGALLLSLTQNLRAEVMQPLLAAHQLEHIEPDKWYPQGPFMNVLREIERRFTFEELVAVGVSISQQVPLPPEVNSIEACLTLLDFGHQSTSRNIHPEEGIIVEKVSPTHFRVVSNVPAPPFMAYGVIWGYVRRFKKKNESPTLILTETKMPYVIEVKW